MIYCQADPFCASSDFEALCGGFYCYSSYTISTTIFSLHDERLFTTDAPSLATTVVGPGTLVAYALKVAHQSSNLSLFDGVRGTGGALKPGAKAGIGVGCVLAVQLGLVKLNELKFSSGDT
jgi:hypothetical protein